MSLMRSLMRNLMRSLKRGLKRMRKMSCCFQLRLFASYVLSRRMERMRCCFQLRLFSSYHLTMIQQRENCTMSPSFRLGQSSDSLPMRVGPIFGRIPHLS
jgi:hypothetical protein